MNKKFILGAFAVALACACQPRNSDMRNNNQQQDDDYNKRRQRQQQGGCCETEKPQAAPQQAAVPQATVATPEVKVEKAQ